MKNPTVHTYEPYVIMRDTSGGEKTIQLNIGRDRHAPRVACSVLHKYYFKRNLKAVPLLMNLIIIWFILPHPKREYVQLLNLILIVF
jgi:hypothetical protein